MSLWKTGPSDLDEPVKGHEVEFRRFFFHLFVVVKLHATSNRNMRKGSEKGVKSTFDPYQYCQLCYLSVF